MLRFYRRVETRQTETSTTNMAAAAGAAAIHPFPLRHRTAFDLSSSDPVYVFDVVQVSAASSSLARAGSDCHKVVEEQQCTLLLGAYSSALFLPCF